MARPKPTVLLEYTDKKTYRIEQILMAEGVAIWAVFYQNAPFNLKTFNGLADFPGAKYKKTSFATKAHAVNLAERLNAQFKTTDFAVVKLVSGILVDDRS